MRTTVAAVLALAVLLAGCNDDNEDAATKTDKATPPDLGAKTVTAPAAEPDESLTADQTTEPEAVDEQSSPDLAATAYLDQSWADATEEQRAQLCDGFNDLEGSDRIKRIREVFPDVPSGATLSVLYGFVDDACGLQPDVEVAEPSGEGKDDALFLASMEGTISDDEAKEMCQGIDRFGMDLAVEIFREGFDSNAPSEADISDQAFEEFLTDLCADYEAATVEGEENWVRGSDDAWYTEAAIKSIWSNLDQDGKSDACRMMDVTSVDTWSRTFASEVLEKTWSDDAPPIDIQAVEETLVEVCDDL